MSLSGIIHHSHSFTRLENITSHLFHIGMSCLILVNTMRMVVNDVCGAQPREGIYDVKYMK